MSNLEIEYTKIVLASVMRSNMPTLSENVKAALIAASVTIILGIVSNTITIIITYNNSKEKKLLSYGKFYIEYVALLVQLILHCDMLRRNSPKEFRQYLENNLILYAQNNNANSLSQSEKREIELIYNILLSIHKLFRNGSYYPLSRSVHKTVVKLEKTIEVLIWIHDNKANELQIHNLRRYIKIPNLQKHMDKIK